MRRSIDLSIFDTESRKFKNFGFKAMEDRLIGLLKSEYVFSHVKFNTKHKRSMTTLASLVIKRSSFIYYAPARRKGQVSVAFVCPSVCLSVSPSVAYIPNNLRTQRPSVPKFRMKVPHL